MDAAKIYSVFEERRAELGLSQADVGRLAFGKADNAPLQNIKKGSSPSVERVAAIAAALGLELRLGAPTPTVIRPDVQAEIDATRGAMTRLKAAICDGPREPKEIPIPKTKKEAA